MISYAMFEINLNQFERLCEQSMAGSQLPAPAPAREELFHAEMLIPRLGWERS